MPHPLCEALLYVNGAVATTAVGFFLYSDRTDGIIGALKGTETTRTEMRRRIVNDLGDALKPIFLDPFEPSLILGTDGGPIDRSSYSERATNPIDSEAFKEAIKDFVDDSHNAITDYRSLSLACAGWCYWSGLASRLLFLLILWQAVCLAAVLFDKYGSYTLPDWLIIVGSTLSGVLVIAAAVCIFIRIFHYARVARLRLIHGEL